MFQTPTIATVELIGISQRDSFGGTDDLGACGATLSQTELPLHTSNIQHRSRGADRDRTDDLFVANEALSQTELQPHHSNLKR